MARTFSSAEANRLIKDSKSAIAQLSVAQSSDDKYRTDVRNACYAMIDHSLVRLLADVPIEEINRNKNGFRVKALRESGYETIADVYGLSAYTLAGVRGIGDETAYSIKFVVDQIASSARQGLKIRISTDDRNENATQLLAALYGYRRCVSLAEKSRRLLSKNEGTIQQAVEAISPATNGFKWLFTSKAKKEKATQAYIVLNGLFKSNFSNECQGITDELDEIAKFTDSSVWDDFAKISISYFTTLEEINPGILGADDTWYGLPENLARLIEEQAFFPDGLLCDLRRYQEWGVKYVLHQERVLLGDEMGLGKTVQAIASMVSLKNTGALHFMVVCPASVLANWCREITKMSRLRVVEIHGPDKRAALDRWIKEGGVGVTTYETTGNIDLEDDFHFAMLVVDEAHYIKNPDANRTINVKKLSNYTNRLLFMTGTALENKVSEMISLIRILQPAVASSVHGMEGLSSAPQFREMVAPVYYRRKRDDVLTELPELIENKEWCSLLPAEEKVYEKAVLGKHYAEARRVSWNAEDIRKSCKARRMLEIIDDAEEDNRKVIAFSFFLSTIECVQELLGDRCMQPITGSVSPQRRQEIIDEFDKAPAGTVLVAQIQAGGTGLNIQSASVVIICEPQFKPSIENQAISRAYRMGQTRTVLVHRLLCENTVDERITELLDTKQKIFDAFADKSVAANQSKELDDKTFGNIIQEEIDRINAKNKSA